MNNVQAAQRQRYVEAAKRYARANASDPFAFNRCMTHIDNGIVGIIRDGDKEGEEAIYTADEFLEERQAHTGGSYTVTAYRNVKRP